MPEHFPITRTWVGDQLASGEEGRAAVNRYIMEVYERPLRIYVLGSSLRRAGEPRDLVAGFFEDRLGRPGFLDGWQGSGFRLHRWLINGLHFYVKELGRKQRRGGRMASLDDHPPSSGADVRAAEVDFTVEAVRLAMSRAERACRESGLGRHWDVFCRRAIGDEPYPSIAADLGLPIVQVRRMARTARDELRGILEDILERDGVPPQRLGDEMAAMHERMHS